MYVHTYAIGLGNTREKGKDRKYYEDKVKILSSTDTVQEYFEIWKNTFSLRQN